MDVVLTKNKPPTMGTVDVINRMVIHELYKYENDPIHIREYEYEHINPLWGKCEILQMTSANYKDFLLELTKHYDPLIFFPINSSISDPKASKYWIELCNMTDTQERLRASTNPLPATYGELLYLIYVHYTINSTLLKLCTCFLQVPYTFKLEKEQLEYTDIQYEFLYSMFSSLMFIALYYGHRCIFMDLRTFFIEGNHFKEQDLVIVKRVVTRFEAYFYYIVLLCE